MKNSKVESDSKVETFIEEEQVKYEMSNGIRWYFDMFE